MARNAFEHAIHLMWVEADTRLADAQKLNQSLPPSDSGYLLELLALEILLKALASIHRSDVKLGHNYDKLFRLLPDDVQARVLANAQTTRATADYSDVDHTLGVLSGNFIRMRYPYEAYSGMTQEEYQRLGAEWAAAGSRIEDAKFVYHPAELNGLTHALSIEVQDWLGADPA